LIQLPGCLNTVFFLERADRIAGLSANDAISCPRIVALVFERFLNLLDVVL